MSETAKPKRTKANGLSKSKKLKIGKYKQDFPELTIAEIAKEFGGATENQVRRAIEQYESGELNRKRTREPVAKNRKTMGEKSLEDILKDQLHYSAASLYNANYLSADEKITSLKNLVVTKNMIDKQELANHMKGSDAGFIYFMYRRYKNPNLTDEEIIVLFHEDIDRYKRQESEQ